MFTTGHSTPAKTMMQSSADLSAAVWGMAAILTVAVAAGGCIPAPGMQNCFYVLLPYLGEFLGAASVIWALAKLGTDWGTVREYNYKKSVAVLPCERRSRRSFLFSASFAN